MPAAAMLAPPLLFSPRTQHHASLTLDPDRRRCVRIGERQRSVAAAVGGRSLLPLHLAGEGKDPAAKFTPRDSNDKSREAKPQGFAEKYPALVTGFFFLWVCMQTKLLIPYCYWITILPYWLELRIPKHAKYDINFHLFSATKEMEKQVL